MGGRGKTPLVAHLAHKLLRMGERPAILSRGYKRRRPLDGVVVVSDGQRILADLDTSGDEPLMLARALPGVMVFVCDQRAIAGALAEQVYGATSLILDDGFQHRSMARDVDIVVVTPDDMRDRRLPFGRLREPVSALSRADLIVLDGDGVSTGSQRGRRSDENLPTSVPAVTPVFSLDRRLGSPRSLDPAQPLPDRLSSVVAVAGIARPARFVEALTRSGFHVVSSLTFADHHRYTRDDVSRISDAARASGADAVLTTAKDAVRMERLQPFAIPIGVVPLEVSVTPAAAFDHWLATRVSRAPSGREASG